MGKVDTRQIDYLGYASKYDAARFEGSQNAYLERVRNNGISRAIGLCDFDRRILDVGCGTGRGLLEAGRWGFTDLTGIDFTPAMLQRGQRKLAEELPRRHVRLLRADAFALPFADGSFDVVMSLNFLHMFRFDLQRELVREMTRVCRPGGLVVAELESLHKGLFCTRYLEQRRERERTKFNSFWEVRRLFNRRAFRRVRVIGTALPKAYLVFQHWPRIGELVESVACVPPVNWMASRVVVGGRRL